MDLYCLYVVLCVYEKLERHFRFYGVYVVDSNSTLGILVYTHAVHGYVSFG